MWLKVQEKRAKTGSQSNERRARRAKEKRFSLSATSDTIVSEHWTYYAIDGLTRWMARICELRFLSSLALFHTVDGRQGYCCFFIRSRSLSLSFHLFFSAVVRFHLLLLLSIRLSNFSCIRLIGVCVYHKLCSFWHDITWRLFNTRVWQFTIRKLVQLWLWNEFKRMRTRSPEKLVEYASQTNVFHVCVLHNNTIFSRLLGRLRYFYFLQTQHLDTRKGKAKCMSGATRFKIKIVSIIDSWKGFVTLLIYHITCLSTLKFSPIIHWNASKWNFPHHLTCSSFAAHDFFFPFTLTLCRLSP